METTTTKPSLVETFDKEESIVTKLIIENFFVKKERYAIALWKLVQSNEQKSFISNLRNLVKGKEITLSSVYIPINQIDVFENAEIPLLIQEDGVIEKQILTLLMRYFPECTIEKEAGYINLHLDSRAARRLSYFVRLYKQNEAWEPFLLENHKDIFSIARSTEDFLRGNSNYFNISFLKEMVIFKEDARLNYDKTIIRIPSSAENCFDLNRGTQRNQTVYAFMEKLLLFSAQMHLVADFYPLIAKQLSSQLEEERKLYAEQQKKAVLSFGKELERRIFPVSKLSHKSAAAYAEKNGITHVMLPFTNEELVTPSKQVSFALYNRNQSSLSTDWLLFPPTEEQFDLPNMQYHGTHEYVTFDKTSWSSASGKAPHVINQENRFSAALEPALFHETLLSHYATHPAVQALKHSFELIENFPKAFSGIDSSVLTGEVSTRQDKDFDFTSWFTEKTNPKAVEESSVNPLKALLSPNGFTSGTKVIEKGDIVKYFKHREEETSFYSNSTFLVEEIVVENNQLNVTLRTVLSQGFVPSQDALIHKVSVSEGELKLLTFAELSSAETDAFLWSETARAEINAYLLKNNSTSILAEPENSETQAYVIVDTTPNVTTTTLRQVFFDDDEDDGEDDDEEEYDDEEDEDYERDEDYGPEVAPAQPTPPAAPAAVPFDPSAHPFSFVVDTSAMTISAHLRAECLATKMITGNLEPGDIRQNTLDLIQLQGGDSFLNRLGVSETQRPFILPVYESDTSRILGSVILL